MCDHLILLLSRFLLSEYRFLQYTNVCYSAYLPLLSSDTFDNTGKQYNVSQIINSDSSFNLQAYNAYSPIFLSASLAVTYGLLFATITATLTHTILYYGKYIVWIHAHRPLSQQRDIHARLMSVYKEVPDWWYLTIFGLRHHFYIKKYADAFSAPMFVFCVVVIEVWETDLPVWGFVLALLICAFCLVLRPTFFVRFLPKIHIRCVLAFVYTLPLSVTRATTSLQPGLTVITELIIGYALPGRPVAMMLFKTWGSATMSQAIVFMSDLKLAHYMKIAHRPMFFCQVVATIVAGTVQLGVQAWIFSNIEGLCDADQKDGFICPHITAFGNASIIVRACRVGTYFLYSMAQRCCVAVGCHWAATSVFARSALLWPRFLLPCRHPCTIVPVDIAQEVRNRFPQVHQFPSRLRQRGLPASCDSS
jgi:hypothetical protein